MCSASRRWQAPRDPAALRLPGLSQGSRRARVATPVGATAIEPVGAEHACLGVPICEPPCRPVRDVRRRLAVGLLASLPNEAAQRHLGSCRPPKQVRAAPRLPPMPAIDGWRGTAERGRPTASRRGLCNFGTSCRARRATPAQAQLGAAYTLGRGLSEAVDAAGPTSTSPGSIGARRGLATGLHLLAARLP